MINKMFNDPVLLSKETHKYITISSLKNYKHTKSFHFIPVSASEMREVCKFYPIFFIEDNDTYTPIALLGFKENENLMINRNGAWEKDCYIPSIFRSYPFSLTMSQDGQYSIVIDNKYSELNREDGERIFDNEANLTEYGTKIQHFLQETYSALETTKVTLKELKRLKLLKQVDLDIDKDGQKMKVTGLFQIDEEKLNNLRDKDLLDITKKGILMPIYEHIISLSNIQRLASKI